MGFNRSVVAKLLNQANKSSVYKEAWYSFFTFSTQVTFKFVNNGRVATVRRVCYGLPLDPLLAIFLCAASRILIKSIN